MTTVCVSADTLTYPQGGGHCWAYLNWALGIREAGCDVVWLESAVTETSAAELSRLFDALRTNLDPYGLERIAIAPRDDGRIDALPHGALPLEAAAEDADVVLNLCYGAQQHVLDRFRHSALVDIDPGLLQRWVSRGELPLARHDLYFTIGETVAAASPDIPTTGHDWIHTPPPVSTSVWAADPPPDAAPYSTIAHWWGDSIVVDEEHWYDNSKRAAFMEYLDVPAEVDVDLELVLDLEPGDEELALLAGHGWGARPSAGLIDSPAAYRAYIHASRGEFSCAKQSCIRFANAWVSDRTLCYLASGRPAVVQHTGASRLLPDRSGILRFRTPDEAVELLRDAEANYDRHTKEARALAEEHFDAGTVLSRVLERALP